MPTKPGVYPKQMPPFRKKENGVNDPRRIDKPKGAISMTTHLRRMLELNVRGEDADGVRGIYTIGQLIMASAIQKAREGDARHLEILMERTEGKVPQVIDQTTKVDLSGVDDEKLKDLLGKLSG